MNPDEAIEKALAAEAEREQESLEAARRRVLRAGIDSIRDERRRVAERAKQRAHVLVVTTTPSEYDAVVKVLDERQVVTTKSHGLSFFDGARGHRVALARIAGMGAFGETGSAAEVARLVAQTEATSVFLVGMCFGTRPESVVGVHGQRVGDVVVSESVYMYDAAAVRTVAGSAPRLPTSDQRVPEGMRRGTSIADKEGRISRLSQVWRSLFDFGFEFEGLSRCERYASDFWLDRLRDVAMLYATGDSDVRLFFGSVLSGGQLVEDNRYRDWLVRRSRVPQDSVVGGEMEAAGLIASSVEWVVVKGICDFGDALSRGDVPATRAKACHNAARVSVDALMLEPTNE